MQSTKAWQPHVTKAKVLKGQGQLRTAEALRASLNAYLLLADDCFSLEEQLHKKVR